MTTSNSITNHADEMRLTYWGAVPHTLFTALIWISAGLVGDYFSTSAAILFFIVGGTFIFAGGELLRKLMKTPQLITKENRLPQFFTLLAFTVPLSYPLIYLAIRNNIDHFFPAFMILIGAHYLPFVFGYRMITFGILAVILVALGTFISLVYPLSFSIPAYITGGILLVFAALHYYHVKKEIL
jgi:hypothetical protein